MLADFENSCDKSLGNASKHASRLFNIMFYIALIVYCITAVFSLGYYHPDEHYQIIEFAEYISGRTSGEELAWEFTEKIRPIMQPAIFYLSSSFLRSIDISDPYTITSLVRVITGFIMLSVIRKFVLVTSHHFNYKFRFPYYATSYFLWFLPFINVRFTSESLAGLTFLMALTLVYTARRDYTFLYIGALLGLSFIFRFQTAFMSLGLISWLILIDKASRTRIILILVGGLISMFIGIAVDSVFYGEITITPINYFKANVVKDIASSFGVSPWYYYIDEFTKIGPLPLAISILVAIVSLFIKQPRSLICWIVAPFILVHFITPHKEIRFLFPIANLIPYIIIFAIQCNLTSCNINLPRKIVLKSFAVLALMCNVAALSIVVMSPADREGRATIMHHIHSNYKDKIKLWHFNSNFLYKPIAASQQFYFDKNVTEVKFGSYKVDKTKFDGSITHLLIVQKAFLVSHPYLFNQLDLTHLKSGIPSFARRLRSFFGSDVSYYSYELYRINVK